MEAVSSPNLIATHSPSLSNIHTVMLGSVKNTVLSFPVARNWKHSLSSTIMSSLGIKLAHRR